MQRFPPQEYRTVGFVNICSLALFEAVLDYVGLQPSKMFIITDCS